MVGLDNQGMRLPQAFHQHLGGVAEIGDKSEHASAGMKQKTDRIDGIMGNRKRLNQDVADREFRSGAEKSPIAVLIQRAATPNGFCGERVCVNRHVKLATKNLQTADVIAV